MKYIYHIYLKLHIAITSLINNFYFLLLNVDAHKSCKIRGRLFIRNSGVIKIDKNVIINSAFKYNPIGGQAFMSIVVDSNAILEIKDGAGISNSAIFCKNKITIGQNVFIGGDCKIYDTDFHSILIKDRMSIPEIGAKSAPVLIKSGAFIGTGSLILKGVVIGENSVIAAGSIVSKSIPDNELWGGNPLKFIKKIKN